MAGLRIVFMGTPDFAVPALRALDAAGHAIACVYSQPARPAGRGKKPRPSAVARAAEALGLPVRTPKGLKDPAIRDAFIALDADIAVVAAYGLILPAEILSAPRYGCLNIHASLLPRWRGAAPVQRAILAGDRESGVTVMLMNEGLDTGPVLLRESLPLGPETTAGELHDSLAALGARLIVTALERLPAGELSPRAQPQEGVTWAAKLLPGEERLDWGRPAATLAREVRALAPRPGAWFDLEGARIRVLAARATAGTGPPGTLLDDALTVACGEGALALLRVQRAGGAAMEAAAFLRGRPVPAGTVLDGDGA